MREREKKMGYCEEKRRRNEKKRKKEESQALPQSTNVLFHLVS
jgi:hypothetical protein